MVKFSLKFVRKNVFENCVRLFHAVGSPGLFNSPSERMIDCQGEACQEVPWDNIVARFAQQGIKEHQISPLVVVQIIITPLYAVHTAAPNPFPLCFLQFIDFIIVECSLFDHSFDRSGAELFSLESTERSTVFTYSQSPVESSITFFFNIECLASEFVKASFIRGFD